MTNAWNSADHPRGNGDGKFTEAHHDADSITLRPASALAAARDRLASLDTGRASLIQQQAVLDHLRRLAARDALVAAGRQFVPNADALIVELGPVGDGPAKVAGVMERGASGWTDAPLICEVELTQFADVLGDDETAISDVLGKSDYYFSDAAHPRWIVRLGAVKDDIDEAPDPYDAALDEWGNLARDHDDALQRAKEIADRHRNAATNVLILGARTFVPTATSVTVAMDTETMTLRVQHITKADGSKVVLPEGSRVHQQLNRAAAGIGKGAQLGEFRGVRDVAASAEAMTSVWNLPIA